MQIFTNPNYDFVRWRWHAIGALLVVILAGLAVITTRGLQKGVDFEGGTIVIVKFDQPKRIQEVRAALAAACPDGGDAVIQDYGGAAKQQRDDPGAPHRSEVRRRPQPGSRRGGRRR